MKWRFYLFWVLSRCGGYFKIGYYNTAYVKEGRKMARPDL